MIVFCSSQSREVIKEVSHNNLVVKLSETAIVKFDMRITQEKANNMRMTY